MNNMKESNALYEVLAHCDTVEGGITSTQKPHKFQDSVRDTIAIRGEYGISGPAGTVHWG